MKLQINIKKLFTLGICFLMISTAFFGIQIIQPAQAEGTKNSSNSTGGSDNIDPSSGTYHQTIPLLSIPGRGIDITLNLRYKSRIWAADPDGAWDADVNQYVAGVPSPLTSQGNHQWLEDYSPYGLGYDLSLGRLYGTGYKWTQGQNNFYWYRFSFEDPDGGSIMFVSDNPDYDGTGRDNHFIAADESGASLLVNNWQGTGADSYPSSMTVILPNGLCYDFTTTAGLLGIKDTGFGPHSSTLDDDGGDGTGGGSGAPSLFAVEKFTKISKDVTAAAKYKYNGPRPLMFLDYWQQQIQYMIDHGQMPHFGSGGTQYLPPTPIPSVTETGSASWACTTIHDMNDNTVTIEYYPHPDTTYPHILNLPQTITDTYGRTIQFAAENTTDLLGTGENAYPKIRLTDISTSISTTGEPYTIHLTYQNDNTDPYQVIDNGPFLDMNNAGAPREVTTQKGNTAEAKTRVILQSITITPPGEVPSHTTSFIYNNYYELTRITLYTGAYKTITYDYSQISPCYRYNQYTGYPVASGTQDTRVVNNIQINDGDGHTTQKEYTYLTYPNTDEHNPLAQPSQHLCFNRVIETNSDTDKRVEYTYYSDTPGNVLWRNTNGYRMSTTASAMLAGMQHTTSTYQDTDFTDNDPGVLRQESQLLYSGVNNQYNHIGTATEYHGNSWEFICSMGYTNWQDGQSTVTIRGVDGYGYYDGIYGPEFAGFRTYWTITSDEYSNIWQDGGQLPYFGLTFSNPAHVKIQNTSVIYIPGRHPINRPYFDVGLAGLTTEINEGELTTWYYDWTDGEIILWGDAATYFGNTGFPFQYSIAYTKQIQYDTTPLIEPSNYNPITEPYHRGLITQQHVQQTGELIQNQYYTNGLLYKNTDFVSASLSSTTTYYYTTSNTGTLTQSTLTDPYHGVTTTLYESNPIGQITRIEDIDNQDVQTYTYNGYGQLLSNTLNGNVIQMNTYQEFYGYIIITSTNYAGFNPEDQTITQTYYDKLKRPWISYERNGDEPTWKTATGVLYDAAGRITRQYLQIPVNQDPIEGRWINIDSYDVFGNIIQITDQYERTTQTDTSAIPRPGEEGFNPWLWNQGIRTKTSKWTSGGVAQDIYTNAQGQTIRDVQRISDNPLILRDTQYFYDQGGRLWKQISPEGLTTIYYYDSVGRLVAIDTPDQTADFHISFNIDYKYPTDDYLEFEFAKADILIESFTYLEDPLQIRTPEGFIHITYDQLGRITEKRFSQTRIGQQTLLEQYSYDPYDAVYPDDDNRCIGRLTKATYYDLTNPNLSYTIQYAYTDQGCVRAQSYSLGALPIKYVHFTYDWLGRISSIRYPNGDILQYLYSGQQVCTVHLNNLPLAEASYDAFRRLNTLNLGDRNAVQSYKYNNQNDELTSFSVTQYRPIKDTSINQDSLTDKETATEKESFNIDNSDKINWMKVNILTEKYTYNQASAELTDIRDANNILKRHYTYDLLGRLTNADLIGVHYNPSTEIYSSSPKETTSITYTMNKDDLRTSQYIRCYNTLSGESSVKEIQTYTYNQGTNQLNGVTRDNTVLFRQDYNIAGSVSAINGESVGQDCYGQITTYHGEEYGYLAGIRVRSTIADTTMYSITIGDQTIAEYLSDGSLVCNHYYGFGQRLATKKMAQNDISFLSNDPHGNLRVITRNHKVDWNGDYTPYGQLIGSSLTPGQIRFDGYITSGTGLTYAYARNYDEKHGMFTSIDPLNPLTNQNPYTYCAGRPILGRDPSGKDDIPPPPPLEFTYTLPEVEVYADIGEDDAFGHYGDISEAGSPWGDINHVVQSINNNPRGASGYDVIRLGALITQGFAYLSLGIRSYSPAIFNTLNVVYKTALEVGMKNMKLMTDGTNVWVKFVNPYLPRVLAQLQRLIEQTTTFLRSGGGVGMPLIIIVPPDSTYMRTHFPQFYGPQTI